MSDATGNLEISKDSIIYEAISKFQETGDISEMPRIIRELHLGKGDDVNLQSEILKKYELPSLLLKSTHSFSVSYLAFIIEGDNLRRKNLTSICLRTLQITLSNKILWTKENCRYEESVQRIGELEAKDEDSHSKLLILESELKATKERLNDSQVKKLI